MADNQENLTNLENLLNEFFIGTTSNERKQDIETILTNFATRPGAWKECLNFLTLSTNQFVSMYCLSTIENVVNKHWIACPWEDRAHLKSYIYLFVVEKNTSLPICVRNKTVKVVVDIARLDWPHFYPDFFINILQLLKRPETRQLGLIFLLTTSEELASPREDLSFERKTELKKLLLNHIPEVFNVLSDFLKNKDIVNSTEDCCLVLRIISHLFSWMPASQVPSSTVDSIFNIAQELKKSEQALSALTTLSEMLYRNWIPPNWEQFCRNTFVLFNPIMVSIDELDPVFIEKFNEFLRLLFGFHLSHPQLYQRLSLDELLRGVLTFTTRQPTIVPGFLSCLDIWSHILENPVSARFSDIFLTLAQEIINKIQFRVNFRQLEELDDNMKHENEPTEWQTFLNTCIELLAKIADINSMKILHLVFDKWVELCVAYSQISETSLQNPQDHNLYCVLRDLSSFTQAIGRLHPYCTGPDWLDESRFTLAHKIIQHLLSLSGIARQLQTQSCPDNFKIYFNNVHAQIMAALKAWCYWLPLLLENDNTKSLLNDLVHNIVEASISPLTRDSSPVVLQHSSAHLLFTLTSTVRPRCLWDSPNFIRFYTYDLSRFQKEDRFLLQVSLTNSLVLPWAKVEDQQWDVRLTNLRNYIDDLTKTYVSLPLEHNRQHKPIIICTLQSLSNIISMYKSEASKTKKLLCCTIQTSVEHTLKLLQLYASDGETNEEILTFFLALFECLQHEVGVSFTQVTIQTLVEIFTKEQLQLSLTQESGGGIQQMLQILDLIIQTPGLAATKLTPMSVTMCLQLAEPLLSENASPTLQETLFQLISSLLLHKTPYFSKETPDQEQRIKEFLLLLKAIGRSMMLPNINLFRENLKNLDKLNAKLKLYEKVIFQRELLMEFLDVLFKTLISKSHTLLNEEIATAIYSLIIADYEGFYNNFLPNFLQANTSLDSSQKAILLKNFARDKDLPSMTQNIFRFVNDLNCYQYFNASLQSTSNSM